MALKQYKKIQYVGNPNTWVKQKSEDTVDSKAVGTVTIEDFAAKHFNEQFPHTGIKYVEIPGDPIMGTQKKAEHVAEPQDATEPKKPEIKTT